MDTTSRNLYSKRTQQQIQPPKKHYHLTPKHLHLLFLNFHIKKIKKLIILIFINFYKLLFQQKEILEKEKRYFRISKYFKTNLNSINEDKVQV